MQLSIAPVATSQMKNSMAQSKKVENQWKSKSLDPMDPEKYFLQLDAQPQPQKKTQQKTQQKSFFKKLLPKTQKSQEASNQNNLKLLPCPKITKINDYVFSIANQNKVCIYFSYKARGRSFDYIVHVMDQPIQFVAGNNSDAAFLITKQKMTILHLKKENKKYAIDRIQTKNIKGIRGLSYINEHIFMLDDTYLYQFTLAETDNIIKRKICFDKEEDYATFKKLNPIQLIKQSNKALYFFGAITESRTYLNMKKLALGSKVEETKNCQILTLTKFNLQQVSLEQTVLKLTVSQGKTTGKKQQPNLTVKVKLFCIDHVFQTGIFLRSKIYSLQQNMFLMALHQEVILIKKHFQKFIAWDNISIVSSKNSEKKGQIVLADKRILVYSQTGQIYAYDIFFNEEQSKLNTPPIDSFKGNQDSQQVLVDALLLKYTATSLMKVLIYFKKAEIYQPGGSKFNTNNQEKKNDNKLYFSIYRITQTEPKQKLLTLMKAKKPQNQIKQFAQRFKISELQMYKGQWTVSKKTVKDILNNLLEISDDKYIQEELDAILKQKPHDLTSLIAIQKKQIERLKKQLADRLTKLFFNADNSMIMQQQVNEVSITSDKICDTIQNLMQSIMFLKKLNYSSTFLSFKQYDFIEIGKLRAASLKQQIKLLSCKKFEKRLKYFLNSFKFLIIASFEEIFEFLLENKNQQQVYEFILMFRFIMPPFVQASSVFQQKQKNQEQFNPHNIQNSNLDLLQDTEKCTLWQDPQVNEKIQISDMHNSLASQKKSKNDEDSFSNLQNFQNMILSHIQSLQLKMDFGAAQVKRKAVSAFRQILGKFIQRSWFKSAAFKQHATLTMSTRQLNEKFQDLKKNGVFKLLVKFLYKKIGQGQYTHHKVQKVLEKFVQQKIIPESFRRNVQARVEVYNTLKYQIQNLQPHFHKSDLNMLEDFLIMKQDKYFEYLFRQFRNLILNKIKDSYESIQPGFFRQRFQIYLNSELVELRFVILFLDEFQEQDKHEQIRIDVFKCIKNLLRINDYENTKKFNEKSLDKAIFMDGQGEKIDILDLNEQAKIPYGFFFFDFFSKFDITDTYETLIESSQIIMLSQNSFLTSIVQKYCRRQYKLKNNACWVEFEDGLTVQKLESINIHCNPLNFFSIMLYLLDILDFKISHLDLFDFMVRQYLFNNCFDDLKVFIHDIDQFDMNNLQVLPRNLQLFDQFKQANDLIVIFCENTLEWIKQRYSFIKTVEQISKVMNGISEAFKILQIFTEDLQFKKEKAFFEMLSLIQQFDKQILLQIPTIRDELHFNAFLFLIHIVNKSKIQIFKDMSHDEVNNILHIFECIYYHFLHSVSTTNIDMENQNDFSRFLIELCDKFINKSYIIATKCVLEKIISNKYYERDIVLTFLSLINIGSMLSQQKAQMIGLYFKNKTQFYKKFKQLLKKVKDFEHDPSYRTYAIQHVLKIVLSIQQPLQAFYYLHRLQELKLMEIHSIVIENCQFEDENTIAPYMVLSAYIRCLKKYLGSQFYPTLDFFSHKYSILTSITQRVNLIKDFNIALSRLNALILDSHKIEEKSSLQESYIQLEIFYKKYMQSIGVDPFLNLTQDDINEGLQRIVKYTTQHSEHSIDVSQQFKKQAQREIKDFKKIKQKVKVQKNDLLQKQVANTISEAKKATDRFQQASQKKRITKTNIVEKKMKELQELKRKQTEELQSVKSSFKSSNTSKVNEIIDSLKKKRQKKKDSIDSNNHVAPDHEYSIMPLTPIKQTTPSMKKPKPTGDNLISSRRKAFEQQKKSRELTQQKQIQQINKALEKQIQLSKSQRSAYENKTSKKKIQNIGEFRSSQKQMKTKQTKVETTIKKQIQHQEAQQINPFDLIFAKKKPAPQPTKKQEQKKVVQQSAHTAVFSIIPKKTEIKSEQKKQIKRIGTIQSGSDSQYTKFSGNSQYQVQIRSPKQSMKQIDNEDDMLPVTLINKVINQSIGNNGNSVQDLQMSVPKLEKKLSSQKNNSFKNINQAKIDKLFAEKEPQCSKYLDKLKGIKQGKSNAIELMKKVYKNCIELDHFIVMLHFLLGVNNLFSKIIQEKILSVYGQMSMLGVKIDFKQLFTVELFFKTFPDKTPKEYYEELFELMTHNIEQILRTPNINIHAINTLFKFGLGSQVTYMYKVNELYIKTQLDKFSKSKPDEKSLTIMVEKLKNLYSNLDPNNRSYKFIHLIDKMRNGHTKDQLIAFLKQNIDNNASYNPKQNEFFKTIESLTKKK